MSDNIRKYPLILFRRSRDHHESLRRLMGDFEALLVAQCYTVDIDKVRDIAFTAVIHDDQVKFLRRVLDVEPVDDPNWQGGTHFVTSGRVPPHLRKIEGRAYTRGLRSTKYKGVFLINDLDTDEVWIEDSNGRVC